MFATSTKEVIITIVMVVVMLMVLDLMTVNKKEQLKEMKVL